MSNEVVITSGKTLAVGSEKWAVKDPGVPIPFVDKITEATQGNGIVALSFGVGIQDANSPPEVVITTRVRMSLGTAQFLRNLLDGMITDALKPVDKSQTN